MDSKQQLADEIAINAPDAAGPARVVTPSLLATDDDTDVATGMNHDIIEAASRPGARKRTEALSRRKEIDAISNLETPS
jgi:hypothetical protein